MVQLPALISLVMSSTNGSSQPVLSLTSLMFFTNSGAKPSFLANLYMIVWSGFDSNRGSITFSRHWIERFEAVTLPEVSICVAAGSRYTPSLRSGMAEAGVGYGAMIPIRSTLPHALFLFQPRGRRLGAWPQFTIPPRVQSR